MFRSGPRIIGYREDGRPIWSIMGAAPDDEIEDGSTDSEDEEGEDSEEGEEGEEGDEPEEKPAAKKAPAKAPAKAAPAKLGAGGKSALQKERDRAKNAERQLRELRRRNESDGEKMQREAEEEAEKRYKPQAIKAYAQGALAAAKIKGDPARATKLLDMEELDLDEDGTVIGLDEQIAQLKTDYPDLFEPAVVRKRVSTKVDGAGKKAPSTEPKTSAEKIAALYSS
jgi:hypothetical protein